MRDAISFDGDRILCPKTFGGLPAIELYLTSFQRRQQEMRALRQAQG